MRAVYCISHPTRLKESLISEKTGKNQFISLNFCILLVLGVATCGFWTITFYDNFINFSGRKKLIPSWTLAIFFVCFLAFSIIHSGNMFGFGLFIYLQLSIKYLKILKNKQKTKCEITLRRKSFTFMSIPRNFAFSENKLLCSMKFFIYGGVNCRGFFSYFILLREESFAIGAKLKYFSLRFFIVPKLVMIRFTFLTHWYFLYTPVNMIKPRFLLFMEYRNWALV